MRTVRYQLNLPIACYRVRSAADRLTVCQFCRITTLRDRDGHVQLPASAFAPACEDGQGRHTRSAQHRHKLLRCELFDSCRAIDQDECERRPLVVNADHQVGIPQEVLSFDTHFPGCEHQFITVENEPYRRYVRITVRADG